MSIVTLVVTSYSTELVVIVKDRSFGLGVQAKEV